VWRRRSAPYGDGGIFRAVLGSWRTTQLVGAPDRHPGMADMTTQVLIEIRDEIREVRDEARKTNVRLDQTVDRLDRLDRRQVEAEVRISTEIVGVASAVRELKDFLVDEQRLAVQVGDHERRISALEHVPR
jgi:hypothetical protein